MSTTTPDPLSPLPGRQEWIDTIRAAACLMVVLLHAAAYYVTNTDIGSSDWNWANAVDSATRACVPLFFMITGYLFLDSRAPKGRNIFRVASSIAVYSAMAIAIAWALGGSFPLGRVLALPYQPAFYHLWYLYALLGIYLLASIITVRLPTSWSMLMALMILMFVLNDAGLAPNSSSVSLDGSSIIYLLLALSGAVLGNLLATINSSDRRVLSWMAFIVFCSSVVGITWSTHNVSTDAGTFVSTFYSYSHPFVIAAALSCFTWLHLARIPRIIAPVIRRISEHSLAIYGVHAFVLEGTRRVASLIETPAALEIAVVFLFVTAASYLVARLLRLIDPKRYFT
jgi:surface polysaccharide O-acyltransferase-like enzyme